MWRCLPWFLDSNSTQTCVAATIFETVPFGAPSATNWRCREKGFAASILYRNLPTSVTWETTICKFQAPDLWTRRIVEVSNLYPACTLDATVTPTITTPPPDAPSRTSSPSASSQPTSLSPSPNDGENKAWIAGAVLGPIAFLALGAATYWSWMRRREQHKRKPKIAAKQEARFQDDDTQQAGPQYGPQYGPQSGPQPELSDAAAVFMLPASPVQRTPELPGY